MYHIIEDKKQGILVKNRLNLLKKSKIGVKSIRLGVYIFFELTLFQNIFYHFHKENIVCLE